MSDQWETCEIEAVSIETDGHHARFWAKANSPEGEYNAGESEPFTCALPIKSDYQAQTELQGLIRRLIDEGWETDPLQEVEPHWYSLRFRRHISL
jgi:hypothetical protein